MTFFLLDWEYLESWKILSDLTPGFSSPAGRSWTSDQKKFHTEWDQHERLLETDCRAFPTSPTNGGPEKIQRIGAKMRKKMWSVDLYFFDFLVMWSVDRERWHLVTFGNQTLRTICFFLKPDWGWNRYPEVQVWKGKVLMQQSQWDINGMCFYL